MMNTCERCNGTGLEDSGGVQPWGEQIIVECECRLMERNMDESRKLFQSWFEEWFGEPPLTPWGELWCGDGYSAEDIDHMWDAWKGSRAAIEIEFPAACADDEYFNDGVFQPMRYERDVERAIRAAGIKVKE